ncbi:unnamed protein product [[Candida] boidinii]|nr:unnamed protein product [[Candida] boidinii]
MSKKFQIRLAIQRQQQNHPSRQRHQSKLPLLLRNEVLTNPSDIKQESNKTTEFLKPTARNSKKIVKSESETKQIPLVPNDSNTLSNANQTTNSVNVAPPSKYRLLTAQERKVLLMQKQQNQQALNKLKQNRSMSQKFSGVKQESLSPKLPTLNDDNEDVVAELPLTVSSNSSNAVNKQSKRRKSKDIQQLTNSSSNQSTQLKVAAPKDILNTDNIITDQYTDEREQNQQQPKTEKNTKKRTHDDDINDLILSLIDLNHSQSANITKSENSKKNNAVSVTSELTMVENDLSKNNSLLISNKQEQQQQMMKNNEIESFLSFDGIENSGITSQSNGNDLLLDINESSNTVIKEHNSNNNRKHSKNFRRKSQPHGSPVSCSEDDENDDLYSFTPPSCSNTPNTMFSLTKTNSAIESISGTTVVSSPSFFDQPIKEETEPFSLLDIPLDTGLSGKDITVDFSTDNFDFKDFTME